MTTDFNKLTRYECALIGMIVLGLAIIGFEIFSSLPNSTQASIKQGIAILDIHESVIEQSNQMAMLLDVTDDIFPAFYDSFAETLAIDEELLAAYNFSVVAIDDVKTYATSIFTEQVIAMEYQGGSILGVSTDTKDCDDSSISKPKEDFYYTFETPTIEYAKSLLPSLAF